MIQAVSLLDLESAGRGLLALGGLRDLLIGWSPEAVTDNDREGMAMIIDLIREDMERSLETADKELQDLRKRVREKAA